LHHPEVVVTGIGVVSPIGIGREAFWRSLCQGQSGVGRIGLFDPSGLPVRIAAEVRDFDAKRYVAQRKQLKVMCRDAQLGVAAAALACRDAGLGPGKIDPERFGVVLGADRICTALDDSEPSYRPCLVDGRFDFSRWWRQGAAASFPLNFLKVLPNMIASHVSIAEDARGPNNTIHQAEASGLLAVAEAAEVIRRGAADVMLAGGASSQLNPFDCIRHCVMGCLSPRQDDPAAVMRPFDADRDGQVFGEGAAIFVLERRRHAEARGATVLAAVLAAASACGGNGDRSNLPERPFGCCAQIGPVPISAAGDRSNSLRRAMLLALTRADLPAAQLGHVNAHGLSTAEDDAIEARAIADVVPEAPVTAPKSFFGNLGAAAGTMEMAVSVLALGARLVPPTLNYRRPDPRCPIRVIHGEPLTVGDAESSALLLNRTAAGQAVAVVVAGL
jgi:3-oxoacyl-[acyl-carrier-protein] synthase II